MPLTKAQSDAGFAEAMTFINEEIQDPSITPSMFEGAAESGLQKHEDIVRKMSDRILIKGMAAT